MDHRSIEAMRQVEVRQQKIVKEEILKLEKYLKSLNQRAGPT